MTGNRVAWAGLGCMIKKALPLALAAVCVMSGPTRAQTSPPKFGYSYGYQPYDDRNPTGFNHPNDMGYGRYVYSPKFKGRRSAPLSYRRFKGY